MKKRVIAGAIIFVIIVGMLMLRQFVFQNAMDILILAVSCICSVEIACALHKEGKADFRLVRSLFGVAINLALYFVFLGLALSGMSMGWITIMLVFTLVCAIFISIITFVLIWAFNSKKKKADFDIVNEFFKSLLPMIYPTALLVCFYFLNHFGSFGVNIPASFALFPLALVFLISPFTDMFAMYGGTLMKGPKLIPMVSPKKTISGAVSGLVFGTAIGIGAFFIFNLFPEFNAVFTDFNITWWKILIISVFASVLNQVGDIFESFLKRKLKVKDMSNLIPGHGGFCDRMDGFSGCVLVILISFCIMML